MTRETKIGLLVGLAFIIVIGVLLSDHIQSSTEPRRAELTASSAVLQRGIDVPGGQSTAPTAVVPPSVVQPTSTVVTNDFLTQAPRPEAVIRIGPGSHQEATPAGDRSAPVVIGPDSLATGPQVQLPTHPAVPLLADGPSTQTQVPTHRTHTTPPQNGVVVTPNPEQQIADVLGARQSNPAAPTPATTAGGARTHLAVEGDSVYRMTIKYYGAYSKSREALIVKANPSMGGRADRISIGQTYTIPALPGAQSDASNAIADRAQQARETVPPVNPAPKPVRETPAPVARQSTYTVRDGDSLWRIADRTGASIAEIKSLNKDLLRGGDVLRPGMTLRLPAKSASAAVN